MQTKKRKVCQPRYDLGKEHHDEYAGNYVALKNGELVAYGKTIKEADTKAKAKGCKKTFAYIIFRQKTKKLWGGW